MEKISDSQIKFTLTAKDLIDRNINITDLTYESEKTRQLFREILDEAKNSCNFRPDNTPLMIEAMPVEDGIMIIISKVKNTENLKSGLDLRPDSKGIGRYKLDDFLDVKDVVKNSIDSENSKVTIYCFETMDNAANSAKRISPVFSGESSLYKNKDSYYLILNRPASGNDVGTDNIEVMLSEYGTKQTSGPVAKAYITEHGEAIIKTDAVSILSTIFA